MHSASIRARMCPFAALVLLGSGLLWAGGCAAPSDSEKARTATVSGQVLDQAGHPVAGAQVLIIDQSSSFGSQPFLGDRGPFPTDANGKFTIGGLPVNVSHPVVVSLLIEKPGSVDTVASVTLNSDTTIGGRTLSAGSQTVDIVVTGTAIPDIQASLAPVGTTQQVGPEGATLTAEAAAPLQQAPGQPALSALAPPSITIPPQALTSVNQISITQVPPASLPAPTPTAPTATLAQAFPSFVAADPVAGPGKTVNTPAAVAAVDLQPEGLQFPPGRPDLWPVITLPLPMTKSFYGPTIPILYFDKSLGQWVFQADKVARTDPNTGSLVVDGRAQVAGTETQPVAVFRVQHFSVWSANVMAHFQFGAAAKTPIPQSVVNLADAEHPELTLDRNDPAAVLLGLLRDPSTGNIFQYTRRTWFFQSLPWTSNSLGDPDAIDAATRAFAAVTMQVPNGYQSFTVPVLLEHPDGRRLIYYSYSVNLTLTAEQTVTLAGTRSLWTGDPTYTSPVSVVATHPQGFISDF